MISSCLVTEHGTEKTVNETKSTSIENPSPIGSMNPSTSDSWAYNEYTVGIEGIYDTFNYFNLSKYGGGWQYEVTRDWTDAAFTNGKFIGQDAECIVGLLSAYNLTGNIKYLRYAEDIWNWDQRFFFDDVYGGYYVRLNQDNSIAIGDKGMFEHGWFGLATTQLYIATGNSTYLDQIAYIYTFVTSNFYDVGDGSYYSALSRDLGILVSDVDTNWCAPYPRFLMAAYSATGNSTYGDKAIELVDNLMNYAYDSQYGWIVNRVSSDWSSFSNTAKGWYDALQIFIDAYRIFGNTAYLTFAQTCFDDIQHANSTVGYLMEMNRDWTSSVNNELLGEEDPGVAIAYLRIANALQNTTIMQEAYRYKDAIYTGLYDSTYGGIYRRIYSSGSQSTWKQWCGAGRVMEMLAEFAISHDSQTSSPNKALYFDGSDEVIIPSDSSLNPTTAITVMAWINADDWDGNRRILQKGVDDQYRLIEEGNLEFSLAGISGADIETPLPTTGTWHHIAGTYDGSTIRLYVDGVEKASGSASGPIQTSSTPLYIGNKPFSSYSGDFFKGIIDEVRIYNRALLHQEINDTMSNELPATSGLVLYLSFDALEGSTCPDLSGYGNDGTNYGAEIVTSFEWGEMYDWVVEGTAIPFIISGIYDVDEDGKLEIWANDEDTMYIRVYEANATDSYEEIWNYYIGPDVKWSRDQTWFGDTDNDTKLEAVMNTGNWPDVWYLRIFECTGDNAFTQTFFYDISSLNDPQCPACGDVDGDGYCEIFIGANDYNVGFFENTGDNSYVYKGTIPDSRTKKITIGDLDGDSSLDMVLGGEYYDRKVSQWEATGDDTYAISWETPGDVSTYGCSVKIIDLDLDGFNEIWCSGANSRVTRLYETTGDNSFVDRWDFTDKGGNDPGYLFDADGNGWPEIAWTSRYSGSGDISNQEIFIYEATGDNSYQMKWQSGLLSGEEGPVFMGDFDNDGFSEMLYHRTSGIFLECTVDLFSWPYLNVNREPLVPCQDDVVNVTLTVNSISGINQSILSYSYDGGDFTNVSMSNTTGWWIGEIPTFPTYTEVQYKVYVQNGLWEWTSSSLYSYQVIDTEGPIISTIRDPITPIHSETVTINATVVDASTIEQVLLRYSSDNQETWTEISMSQVGNNWIEYIPLFLAGTNVSYYVRAEDSEGNWGASNMTNYTVDDIQGPSIFTLRNTLYPSIGEMVEVTAAVYDTSMVDTVWLLVRINNGSWINYWMNKEGHLYSASISGQDLGIFVEYRVQANDTVGNWGISSVEAYTVIDCVNPTISLLTELTDTGQNEVVEIQVEVDDSGGVKQVLLCYSLDSGITFTNTSMGNVSGVWTASIPLGIVGESVYFSIYAEDQAGNWENSQLYTYLIIDVLSPNVIITITPLSSNQTEALKVEVEISDDSEILNVQMRYSVDNWANESELSLELQDGVWAIQIEIIGTAVTIQYQIVVEDSAHNIYESGIIFYTLVQSPYPDSALALNSALVVITSGGIGVAAVLIILFLRRRQDS